MARKSGTKGFLKLDHRFRERGEPKDITPNVRAYKNMQHDSTVYHRVAIKTRFGIPTNKWGGSFHIETDYEYQKKLTGVQLKEESEFLISRKSYHQRQ